MAKSDYTSKEIEFFKAYLIQHPKAERWGMDVNGKTVWIPIQYIKQEHLNSILNWIGERPTQYRKDTFTMIQKEAEHRRILNTKVGKILYGSKTR